MRTGRVRPGGAVSPTPTSRLMPRRP